MAETWLTTALLIHWGPRMGMLPEVLLAKKGAILDGYINLPNISHREGSLIFFLPVIFYWVLIMN